MPLVAANGLIMKLKNEVEPFRVITDEKPPWEEKSTAALRLSYKMQKQKTSNICWKRKRRHQRNACKGGICICISFDFSFFGSYFNSFDCSLSNCEFLQSEHEQFNHVDEEADKWRASEIAKGQLVKN